MRRQITMLTTDTNSLAIFNKVREPSGTEAISETMPVNQKAIQIENNTPSKDNGGLSSVSFGSEKSNLLIFQEY